MKARNSDLAPLKTVKPRSSFDTIGINISGSGEKSDSPAKRAPCGASTEG